MGSIQNLQGRTTEEYIADCLFHKGYWVYVLPKKIGGQPFDIIALKDNKILCVDAKHLEASKKSFTFDRIEPNQRTSMWMARNHANIKELGFVIQAEIDLSRLFYLSYDKLLEEEQNGAKSVKLEALIDLTEIL